MLAFRVLTVHFVISHYFRYVIDERTTPFADKIRKILNVIWTFQLKFENSIYNSKHFICNLGILFVICKILFAIYKIPFEIRNISFVIIFSIFYTNYSILNSYYFPCNSKKHFICNSNLKWNNSFFNYLLRLLFQYFLTFCY